MAATTKIKRLCLIEATFTMDASGQIIGIAMEADYFESFSALLEAHDEEAQEYAEELWRDAAACAAADIAR